MLVRCTVWQRKLRQQHVAFNNIPLAILSLLNELPAEDPYLTGLTVSIEGEAISSVRVTERARLTWSSGILDSARR